MRLLLVEDARDLASAVKAGLERHGFAVDVCGRGDTALELAGSEPYLGIILDRLLPGLDGVSVCRTLRQRGSSVPVLMLTARDSVEDRIEGLDAGADDYLVKPFAFGELLARARALTRRQGAPRSNRLQAEDLTLDLETGLVTRGGRIITLSPKELLLLTVFLRQPGRLLTHDQLARQVWSFDGTPTPELVRAHVKNLRRKIAQGGERRLIETVHGLGYRLAP